jgi:hypothetical protein
LSSFHCKKITGYFEPVELLYIPKFSHARRPTVF